MNAEEHPVCPHCGAAVTKTDVVCRSCGGDLVRPFRFASKEPEVSVESSSEETDVREYSVFERFFKLVVSPSNAMEDVARWPDYTGPVVILFLLCVLAAVDVSLVFQKIQLTGDPQSVSSAQGLISGIIATAVVIGVVIVIVFWLVKSLLVKALCDDGSGWSFATAASVTGYAYIADLIIGIISSIVVIPLLPSITINVSDTSATQAAIANYQAQLLWIRLAISVPLTLVGLVWKSYLGGLGTKYGTDESSSLGKGFAVFLGLALLGLLINFLANPNSI